MKILVHVKTNSKFEEVKQQEDGSYVVRTKASPIEGKANQRVQAQLARFFKVSKSSMVLVSGHKSKKKIFRF